MRETNTFLFVLLGDSGKGEKKKLQISNGPLCAQILHPCIVHPGENGADAFCALFCIWAWQHCAFHCLVSFLNFVHLDTVVLHDTGVHLTTVGGFNLQEDASWRLLRSSAAAATTLLAEFGRELRSKIAKLQEGEMSTLSAILHYDSSRFPLLTQFSTKELQLSATSKCIQCETSSRQLRSTILLRGDSRSCIAFKIMQGTLIP